jgi:bifunctional UDP-N-acetylglucosamine pyrophosphorylase / glucosamine-1-phosphate N-acetyltransferase
MTERSSIAIVLAAGKGKRMKSAKPKVMHKIAGTPMLAHVLRAVRAAGIDKIAVVTAPGMEEVAEFARGIEPSVEIFVQEDQLGTAHAVLAAEDIFESASGDVLVLFGDTPLLTPATIKGVGDALSAGADLAVIGFEATDPRGYGRLILDEHGAVSAIREEKDANEAERDIRLCNSGIIGFCAETLRRLLPRIGKQNASGEYYLTDAVGLAYASGQASRVLRCAADEVIGVNAKSDLALAESAMQSRLRARAMSDGVTMVAPETVFLSHDTIFGKDVLIEPHVIVGPGVAIGDNVTLKGFSHLEGATLASGAVVGPFARLRPGAKVGEKARVGNFVEIKQTDIGEGAKVNHLTYIGDASIGAGANIGAGTITCNYDGFDKHRTTIGAGAFVGSNTSLVAPVTLGDGAYIGSGSVISKDVSADALALGRAPQEERKDWAAKFRARRKRGNAPKQ